MKHTIHVRDVESRNAKYLISTKHDNYTTQRMYVFKDRY